MPSLPHQGREARHMREELDNEEEKVWSCGSRRSAETGHVALCWRGEVSHQMGITVKHNQGLDPLLRGGAQEFAFIT